MASADASTSRSESSTSPTVLFLDEPTTGLDPQNRANLWEHLSALRDLGTTIVLTTHYLEEADVLCDRIVIVDHGQVVAEGSPRELKRRVAGDAIVITMKDHQVASERGLALLGEKSFVREISADGDQLRLYVEDGERRCRSFSGSSTANTSASSP